MGKIYSLDSFCVLSLAVVSVADGGGAGSFHGCYPCRDLLFYAQCVALVW
jgi:hypothetical protein